MSVKLKKQTTSNKAKRDLIENLISKNQGKSSIKCMGCIGEGEGPGF